MKITALSILIAAILIGGSIILVGRQNNLKNNNQTGANNVSVVDGKQIIEINAKGGYSPRVTTAKADIPTILKLNTRGTFDCSASLIIPKIGYQKNLPPSGVTAVEIPPQKSGSTLRGLCGMGMYSFRINFN